MRTFTQYCMATAIAACTAFAAEAQTTATAELVPDTQKIQVTFEGVSMAIPDWGTGAITLNGFDVTSTCQYVYDPVYFFSNKVTISYAAYPAAVENGGELPDGEYVIVFEPDAIELDFFLNTEPITATLTVGTPVAISSVAQQQLPVATYNIQGQRTTGAKGILIQNGQKSIIR